MHASDSGHGPVKSPATARTFSGRAAEPEGVMNFFCSGTAEANDTRRPVKKIGLIINIDERTVIVSGTFCRRAH